MHKIHHGSRANIGVREQHFGMHIHFVSFPPCPVCTLRPLLKWDGNGARKNKAVSSHYSFWAVMLQISFARVVIAWCHLFVCVGCFELMKPIVNRCPLAGSVLAVYNNPTCIIYHSFEVPALHRPWCQLDKRHMLHSLNRNVLIVTEMKRFSHNILVRNASWIISLLSWKLCHTLCIWLAVQCCFGLALEVAWILSSRSSVEMIEDDYTTYYDLLFLMELGDNTSLSRAQNWIISALTG